MRRSSQVALAAFILIGVLLVGILVTHLIPGLAVTGCDVVLSEVDFDSRQAASTGYCKDYIAMIMQLLRT